MIKTLVKIFKLSLNFLKSHFCHKYLSYPHALRMLWKTRKSSYQIYNFKTVQRFKKSDTIFILGNGPSLGRLSPEQLEEVSRHDSFGVSLSFLKKDLKPTFHQLSLEADKSWRDPVVEAFQPYRKSYSSVVFFFTRKARIRLGHPRTTPEFFPENPICCFYDEPAPIHLEANRDFRDSDFEKSFFYRGTLSLDLALVLKMDYKKIILLGVDLDTNKHFYDDYPEMAAYCKRLYDYYRELRMEKYPSMEPKKDKFHPFDVYLYELNDYLKRRNKAEIFVGFKNNMLHPKLRAYFD